MLASSAAGLAVAGGLTWFVNNSKKKSNWIKVGTVDQLFIYPLKCGKAKEVPVAEFGPIGMKAGPFLDRGFSLMNER